MTDHGPLRLGLHRPSTSLRVQDYLPDTPLPWMTPNPLHPGMTDRSPMTDRLTHTAGGTVDHTDAATYQPSDYSGVTIADLVELDHGLSSVPATAQVGAVLGRIRRELSTRPDQQVRAAYDGRNARRRALADKDAQQLLRSTGLHVGQHITVTDGYDVGRAGWVLGGAGHSQVGTSVTLYLLPYVGRHAGVVQYAADFLTPSGEPDATPELLARIRRTGGQ